MSGVHTGDLANLSLLELFRIELEAQAGLLSNGLLRLEQTPASSGVLENLMRAAHSIKGAARMVDLEPAVRLAHAMEDCFVAAQHGVVLTPERVDHLLAAVDLLQRMAPAESSAPVMTMEAPELQQLLEALASPVPDADAPTASSPAPPTPTPTPAPAPVEPSQRQVSAAGPVETGADENAVRVSTLRLNRLLGLSGEALVGTRWLGPYTDALQQIKRRQVELVKLLDRLWEHRDARHGDPYETRLLQDARHKATECRQLLIERLRDLDEYERRSNSLSSRLNREVLATRMRPFSAGVTGLQRLTRDLARKLGKDVHLELRGLPTEVDRDVLARLEAPLGHLLRNAIDHALESPEERAQAGKDAQATIVVEAAHNAGMLTVSIIDDGRGIDPEAVRARVVARGLVNAELASSLGESELLDFLFLPGFSMRDRVTDVSGRGVGLDVVHTTVRELRGAVRVSSTPGQGTRFVLQLPLTLGLVRALLVEVAGEPYALPLARIDSAQRLKRDRIATVEGHQYCTVGDQRIGLIAARQVLELEDTNASSDELYVVVLGERDSRYGLIVDRLLGERNLAVQSLNPLFGKIRDISAGAVLEDGSPALIFEVDDLLHSIATLVQRGQVEHIGARAACGQDVVKRVLVVDDSITIREVERNLLENRGYMVEVAVDGMAGWNAVRAGQFDLVISDIDMPRMSGLELTASIKNDARLKNTPVMIISYKDRPEDRNRGMEAGADYYLTKGSFHDDALLDAVADLIGAP